MSNIENDAAVRRRANRATKCRALVQTLSNTELSTRARETAWHIGRLINDSTGTTHASPSTIAKRSGGSLRLPHVKEGISILEREKHLKVTKRSNGLIDLALVVRDDIDTPARLSPIGDTDVAQRNERLDDLVRKRFSSTAKVVAIVAQYVLGIDLGDVPQRFLADVVGVSPPTINSAIKSLSARVRRKTFSERSAGVQVAFSSKSEKEAKSNTSSGNSVNFKNSSSGGFGKPKQTEGFDLKRYAEASAIIEDIGQPMTVAGLSKASEHPKYGYCLSPAEIGRMTKAGMLLRRGQYVTTPELGWQEQAA